MTRADTGSVWLRRLETAFAALVLFFGAIGLALLPITTPTYVRAVVADVGASDLTGLGESETLAVAESLRRFVVDPDAPTLPATIDGQPAFDETAVSHLIDVRNVLAPAIRLTVVLVVGAVGWLLMRRRTARGKLMVGQACRAAGIALLAGTTTAIIAGLIDFNAVFAALHGLFFDAGTWVFPDDALMIRVLPLPFWITAGATWGGLIFAEGLILAVFGARTLFTTRADSV